MTQHGSDAPEQPPEDRPAPPPYLGPPARQDEAPRPQPPARPPYPGPPFPGYPPPTPVQPRGVPGWLWPAVAVCALVLGLAGGLLGGALVLGSRALVEDGDVLASEEGAAPLAADNGSVAAVAAKVLPSTVQVRTLAGDGEDTTGSTGSGFVIDRRGHVITNNHVVEAAEDGGRIEVIDVDGRTHRAEIVGRSPVYDVAVLDVASPRGLEPAVLGSSRRMQVGQTVVAIGSPLGLSATVTSGIVSALDRPVTTGPSDASSFINAVQTDAAINPGNSGGPLVNLRGQVVGVNSAIATTGGILGGEAGNIGVGFAIPMEQVRVTARQLLDTGKAEYPVIGANVNTGPGSGGATVVGVPDGTPASRAGLLEGDRIVAVEGERVADGISLIVAIRTHRPGETIELTVVRDGDERTVEVRLDAKVG
ncbi:MAG TPA: trypsin-like peptidase domain-containing protein [Marmoricola sp.]|nr:trypsin-like peptidase domain-containing protein [Marmoricola sp.]